MALVGGKGEDTQILFCHFNLAALGKADLEERKNWDQEIARP